MLHRSWQTAMIGLARSPAVKAFMQGGHATSSLAARYIAGATPESAVARACSLAEHSGVRSSVSYLGEYVETLALVAENAANQLAAIEALGRAGLDVHLSVDPTQVGHGLDPAVARRHLFTLAEAIAHASDNRPGVHCLMLDMEDQSVTDATIALHDALRRAGLPAALTLQAYLRRTEGDISAQVRAGARVRLVSGAFAARSDALTRRRQVKANFRRLVDLMFARAARDAGFYPIVATHDDRLHAHALERAEIGGWRPGEYEFEMLLGIRGDVVNDLAGRGQRVRLYLPFGGDWWPYAARRIGERPRNAWLLARSVLAR